MKHLAKYFRSLSDYFNKTRTYCEIEKYPIDTNNFPVVDLILIAIILGIVVLSKSYNLYAKIRTTLQGHENEQRRRTGDNDRRDDRKGFVDQDVESDAGNKIWTGENGDGLNEEDGQFGGDFGRDDRSKDRTRENRTKDRTRYAKGRSYTFKGRTESNRQSI